MGPAGAAQVVLGSPTRLTAASMAINSLPRVVARPPEARFPLGSVEEAAALPRTSVAVVPALTAPPFQRGVGA